MSSRYLVENFYDVTQFPSHTITGEDETTGFEGFRVGQQRRQARKYYTPQTANVGRYVEAACDRVRFADMLVLERDHNLAGETIRVQASNQSTFATLTESSFTVPSNVYPASRLTAGQPVRTEEGAVLFLFTGVAAKYWRVEVDAMGAGLKPKIVGLYLGQSWAPTKGPLYPYDEEPRELVFSEVRSPFLWAASTRKASGRNNSGRPWIHPLADEDEYAITRYHLHGLFWASGASVMWAVPDVNQAERAWLGYAQPGTYGAAQVDRPARDVVITMSEHEPKAV